MDMSDITSQQLVVFSIGSEEYERRDQTVQLDAALQGGPYRVKRLTNIDA